MAAERQNERNTRSRRRNLVLALCFIVLTVLGIGLTSAYTLLTVFLDGLGAVVVMGPPMLAGLWLVPLFCPRSMPLRWHFMLGAALGLGATSLLVLLLGLAGELHRPVWIGLLGAFTVAGVVRARQLLRRLDSDERVGQSVVDQRTPDAWPCLWLLVCPFLILALLAASYAPGFIWQEEGFGYDVLEYHLQLPKEYLDAGCIAYVPHNVYANFPANVEMLYLLAMIVLGDVQDVGTVANMLHLILGVLTVFAVWVVGREWSSRAGVVCAVAVAATGWLAYLSGLAYVENGMLFFAVVATACLFRSLKSHEQSADRNNSRETPKGRSQSTPGPARWIAAAGVMAGLACGCKYTALPMIALPLALVAFLMPRRSITGRITDGLAFTVAMLVAFSPWLVKNLVMTGNPVFPLMNTVFEASPEGWGPEESLRWERGHRLSSEQQTFSGRAELLWQHVLRDKYQRFGPAAFLIAVAGLLGRRRGRVDVSLLIILVVQIGVWLFATHLYARFAVVLLIPLALLCGRAVDRDAGIVRRSVIVVALVAGCAWDFAFAARLHERESPGGAPASLIYTGEVAGYEYFGVVNDEVPPGAKILLVGEARAFYFQRDVDYCVAFNRNPFLDALRTAGSAQEMLSWLRERGYTHVLVHWGEVRRLAATYGLSPTTDPGDLQAWFNRLSAEGLARLHESPHPHGPARFVELYEVPQ